MAANSEKEFPAHATGFAPASFAVGFDRKQGESFVYGCLIFGILIAVVGIAAQVPYLTLGALVPLAVGWWHYPMIEKGLPQLAANKSGLFVERLGQLDWAAIQSVEQKQTSVRNIILVRLEINLNRTVDQALIEPHEFPVWKNVMMRNWKKSTLEDGRQRLTVDLHPLTGNSEDIVGRIRSFKIG